MRKFTVFCALLGLASASQASILTFVANLTGGQEFPAVTTTGLGNGFLQIDTVTLNYSGYVRWKDLIGTPTDSHIHVGIGGFAGGVIYGYGVAGTVPDGLYTKKTFSGTLVNKNPSNVGGAGTVGTQTPADQIANWFLPGKTYMNVHTTFKTGGEIRGVLTPVPEPGTYAVLGLGVAALLRRRRRS
jgi:hypothetical protein